MINPVSFIRKHMAQAEAVERLDDSIAQSTKADNFHTLRHFTQMVAKGHSLSLLVLGSGGLGKTYTVLNTLKETGVNYSFLNTYSTPLSLYRYFYNHNEPNLVLILDDMEMLFRNPVSLSLLKAALWPAMGVRIVSYHTTSKLAEDLPSEFEFKSRIIFCANELPKGENMEALASRTLYLEHELNHKEIVDMMTLIAQKDYKDTSLEERLNCVSFVSKYDKINFRTLLKCFDAIVYARANGVSSTELYKLWERIVIPNYITQVILEGLEQFPNDREAQFRHYSESTGRSRRSFFYDRKAV